MKKIVLLALLLFPALALAQIPSGYVQAEATVPILANGSFGAAWTNLSSSPQLGLLGCVSTFQTTVNGTIDSYGKFSVLLADPGQICPAPSTWTFTFSCYTPPGAFIAPITVTGGGSIDDITSQILAAAPANICQGGSGGRQLTVETNGAPNLSQTLLNFTDTPTILFTNPSGGVESATCATATSSTIGCAKPDNTTVTVSGGVLSATSAASNVTDFKHAGTLLTGAFAPNAAVQVYDYDESAIAPDSGSIVANFRANTGTGKWNVEVPSASSLIQMQNTAAPAGQGVFVPFTACTNDNTDPFSLITLQQCDAKSGILQSSTGGIFGHNATGGFIWSGASLPSGLSPSNVTGVYALSNNWTAATSVGITLNCGAGVAESIPSNQQVLVGPLSGITGSNIGTVTCTLQAIQSTLGSYMDLQQTQLGLWVTYTGSPLTQTAILNIGLPLQYSSFNNTLTVGPYWPNGVTALTVATLPSPSAGQDGGTGYPQYLVSDLATPTIGGACTGGGSTYGWCQSNGSGYVVFALQGGSGGSGTVTSVATDSTMTGGPITTTGTLGVNTAHAYTWTAAHNFSLGLTIASGHSLTNTGVTDGCATWATGVLGSTGVACGSGSGGTIPNTTFMLAGDGAGNALATHMDDGHTTAGTITSTEPISIAGTGSGKVTLNGSSSGSAAISVPAAAGTPSTILLPTTDPSNGQVLTAGTPSGGSVQTSWGAGGGSSGTASIGFAISSGIVASPATPLILAPVTGTVSHCYFTTNTSDGATALIFNIKFNGSNIISGTSATVAAGTAAGTVSTFTLTSGSIAITAAQKWEMDITSGTSSWTGIAQCF